MVANIFSNLCLTKGQKGSFSLEHEFWPNSYKNIIIDKKGQFKDSRIPGLSFGLQTYHNLVETVIRTFPAQKNWFSIAPWFFHNSLVNDYVHFGLVNCAIIYRFRVGVLRHHVDQLGWASCLSPQGPKEWINNQSLITSIFFTPEWLPKWSRLKPNYECKAFFNTHWLRWYKFDHMEEPQRKTYLTKTTSKL